MRFIRTFDDLGRGDVEIAGGKGANLGELTRGGLPVPPGFVLTTDAYRAFVASGGFSDQLLAAAALPADAAPAAYDEPSAKIRALFTATPVPDAIAAELRAARGPLGDAALAVRSSATAEDLEGASFAGQQDTYLNIRGDDALLAAVRDCWASLWTARAMAYRARQGIDPGGVALAVVVQRLVAADAAGVMFTANPTNGRRDETVVSAAWGLGESVVSGAVSTDDVVVAGGRVRSRTTADKAVRTVRIEDGTTEEPVPAADRRRPVLDDAQVVALAGLGARTAELFGAPQDVEWALADGEFAIVQARPVTALPEPETEPPTDWTVPDPSAYYARASIVEQLPDPLTPLFADLIDGSVTRSLTTLMREFMGRDLIGPDGIGLPTINGYAYYRYGRAAMWRMVLFTPKAMRALTGRGNAGAQARWRDREHPAYVAAVERWRGRPLGELSVAALLDGVVELLDAGTAYYTSVQTIIPLAASSEILMTRFYEHLVRRDDDPPAATLLLGYDSAPIRAERSLHDLAGWIRGHADLTAALLAGAQLGDTPDGVDAATWQEWSQRFRAHLDAYGHTVYNLDFANAVPADDPGPLLDALRFHLRGDGADPVERQRRSAERRDAAAAAALARLDPARRRLFRRLLGWAQALAPLREDALADVGLAWPQLRLMVREIGARLVADGVIDQVDDVFWLRHDEILADGQVGSGDRRNEVDDRKALWRGRRRATPPQLLPKGTSWELFEKFLPAEAAEQTGPVLKGVGASAGQVDAPARVLAGPQDFGRMQPGDVLVASITTPAWTSLFAMASAVVTDVGGPLSHSSIVAREYGIPAVLGTNVATRRITDGARIRVDGDAGTVTLLDEDGADPGADEPGPRRGGSPWPGLAVGGAVVAGVTAAVVALRRRRRAR